MVEKARPAPNTDALSADERAIVEDEVDMAGKVGRRLAKSLSADIASPAGGREGRDEELTSLRDQIGEARTEDVPALLAEMMRLTAVRSVGRPSAVGAVDVNAPYFGHLRLEENGRKRDVLVGKRGMVDREAGVVIVDWRNAPVSRIYYRYEEGDDYEEEFGNDVREGTVQIRRTVSFERAELVRVRTADHAFIVKDGNDKREWVSLGVLPVKELTGGAGKATRAPKAQKRSRKDRRGRRHRGNLGHEGPAHMRPDKHLPEIAALIDPRQFDAMTRADGGIVILQGGAGSGKTTVALHRIAYLAFQDRNRFRPHRMLVVVHQPALCKYVERVLPSLEVGDVRVRAYVDWARWALGRVAKVDARRHVDDAPPEVSLVKKHPAMLDAMRAQVQRRWQEVETAVSEAVHGHVGATTVTAALAQGDNAQAPLLQRIRDAQQRIVASAADPDTKERAKLAADRVAKRARNLMGEWEELITDTDLLAPVAGSSEVDAATMASFLRWTSRQVEDAEDSAADDDDESEDRMAVDRQARRGREDERRQHSDDDDDDQSRAIDPFDPALLLNIWIFRAGALVTTEEKTLTYDHIAVDEAQDLSAVEIRPLLIATGKSRSMTLAGDIVQKVVFDNGFDEWPTLLRQLQTKGVEVEPFQLSYRSTAEVVEFARAVLGPLAPETPPVATRSGAPVEAFAFGEHGEEIAFLADALRALMAREPNANVAVLTRYPERATFYAKMLEDAEVPRLRLVGPDGEFSFLPGVDVTHVAKVKGLEYDYVIIAEATEAMFPARDAARHLMHIAATRAAHQLWITTNTQSPSPLLPEELLVDAHLKV